jgi:hypothetical protein
MHALAGTVSHTTVEVDWPDGLGFKEISPVEEDSSLENELRTLSRDTSVERTD